MARYVRIDDDDDGEGGGILILLLFALVLILSPGVFITSLINYMSDYSMTAGPIWGWSIIFELIFVAYNFFKSQGWSWRLFWIVTGGTALFMLLVTLMGGDIFLLTISEMLGYN